MFGTWENSLGGGLDPVVNLQRRIYTCTETRPKQDTNLNAAQMHVSIRQHVHFFIYFFFAERGSGDTSVVEYGSTRASTHKLNGNPLLRLLYSNTVACS